MCLPYNIIITNDSFHNTKGYFRPLPLFFHPFGVPLVHPTLSQGFHFIPPLPVIFSPLRGFLLRIPLCHRGYISFHPCLWSFHPFGVSSCASRFVTGATFHSTPACDLATPSGFPLAHPALSQGLHFIPPLPVVFPPLRGFPCASRFVTGVSLHSTPAYGLFTPSGFPPMRQHIAVIIANPEGVARSQAGVQRSETPAEPTFPHHFEPRRGDRIGPPSTPSGFIFNDGFRTHRGSISFHPCLWSFHPFGVSSCASCLVAGVPFHSTPACGLSTPSGFPLAHPALSQGFHFIPPLPVVFSPLRGFPSTQ